MRIATLAATTALLLLASPLAHADEEWAEGVVYTTKWDEAIKAVQESGKLLFIYNGWEKGGI